MSANGVYEGIAPGTNFLAARAFAEDGCGSYLSVIRALDWIVANRERLNIRVLNLSFSAPPQSYYWDDPLNQAVMAAWQAGITVVVSAGNAGPDPMTIGVPGNVPYVITVGAMTDNYTPYDLSDDRLASFSAAGPTYEGFVKPELIAPGGHITAWMPWDAYIPTHHPGLDALHRNALRDVRHLAGRGRGHRHRRADPATGSLADAGSRSSAG